MGNGWFVIYYETQNGKCSIEEFIDSRSETNQAKILNLIKFLQEKGPNLPRPYADLLRDGIHELRIKLSGDEARTLYFFCYKKYIVLTHAFLKHSKEVPEQEINKAIKIRNDFLTRYNLNDLIKYEKEKI